MIEFINVTKHYPGRHHVLREVNLHLHKGEMALLTGPSGAGKRRCSSCFCVWRMSVAAR